MAGLTIQPAFYSNLSKRKRSPKFQDAIVHGGFSWLFDVTKTVVFLNMQGFLYQFDAATTGQQALASFESIRSIQFNVEESYDNSTVEWGRIAIQAPDTQMVHILTPSENVIDGSTAALITGVLPIITNGTKLNIFVESIDAQMNGTFDFSVTNYDMDSYLYSSSLVGTGVAP